jgi:quinol monooxygenase YgiN
MVSITAVICCRAGHEDTTARALLDVAQSVRDAEPHTRAFFVSRDASDPHVFTTGERFTDAAAMDSYNNSAAVARFFATAKPILDSPLPGSVRQAEWTRAWAARYALT